MNQELHLSLELLRAAHFAADKHRDQRRKDKECSPYINHPIAVAETLARVGGISDLATLQAALLHDTVEDTETSPKELEEAFGAEVRDLVLEVTDDKSLPKQERKRLQVEHAPHLTDRAKQIKVADKVCNVYDILHSPPEDWPLERKLDYLRWGEAVVDGCRGVNGELERHFDELVGMARSAFQHKRA